MYCNFSQDWVGYPFHVPQTGVNYQKRYNLTFILQAQAALEWSMKQCTSPHLDCDEPSLGGYNISL